MTEALKEAGIRNWITITGDLHTFEINLIHTDYGGESNVQAIGVELMMGSVTSSNLKEMVKQTIRGTISGSNPLPMSVLKQMIAAVYGPVSSLAEPVMDEVVRQLVCSHHTAKSLDQTV